MLKMISDKSTENTFYKVLNSSIKMQELFRTDNSAIYNFWPQQGIFMHCLQGCPELKGNFFICNSKLALLKTKV